MSIRSRFDHSMPSRVTPTTVEAAVEPSASVTVSAGSRRRASAGRAGRTWVGTRPCDARPRRTPDVPVSASGSGKPSRADSRTGGLTIHPGRVGSSAGPFTATVVAALAPWFGRQRRLRLLGSPGCVARLRVRAPGPISGRLSTTADWRTGTKRIDNHCPSPCSRTGRSR
jgi:hypothetical protein